MHKVKVSQSLLFGYLLIVITNIEVKGQDFIKHNTNISDVIENIMYEDLNNDGLKDIIQESKIFYGTSSPSSYNLEENSYLVTHVRDVNKDGFLDLIDKIGIRYNADFETIEYFPDTSIIELFNYSHDFSPSDLTAHAIDYNGDSKIDIIQKFEFVSWGGSIGSTDEYRYGLVKLRNKGDGTFLIDGTKELHTGTGLPIEYEINTNLDLNCDGREEYVAIGDAGFSEKLFFVENNILLNIGGSFVDLKIGDIDGNGDFEFVSSSWSSFLQLNRIDKETNSTYEFDGFYADNVLRFELADLDGDNDLDIVYIDNGNLFWLPNENFVFGTPISVYTNPQIKIEKIFPKRINSDDLTDIFANTNQGFIWLENTLSTSTKDHSVDEVVVYPNPTTDKIIVQSDVELSKVELYDTEGFKVLQSQNQNSITLRSITPGIYFCKVILINGQWKIEKIIIQ